MNVGRWHAMERRQVPKPERLNRAKRIAEIARLIQENRARIRRRRRPQAIMGAEIHEIVGAGAEVAVIEALNMRWEEGKIEVRTTCTRASPEEDIRGIDAKLTIEARDMQRREGKGIRKEVNIQVKAVPMDGRMWHRGHIPQICKERLIASGGNVAIERGTQGTVYIILNSDEINHINGVATDGLIKEIREKSREFILDEYIG